MGMFDSFYDAENNEWQTKAYHCRLDQFNLGAQLPPNDYGLTDYQVMVLGGPGKGLQDSWATVRDGKLATVPADRDKDMYGLDYFGHLKQEDN